MEGESAISNVAAENRGLVRCQLAADAVRAFGKLRLEVTGSSMLPTIWPGDVLEVRHQGVAEIQSGDVVLFQRQGQLVAHRVVHRLGRPGGNLLITRGDRQSAADPPTTRKKLGRVTEVFGAESPQGSGASPSGAGWERGYQSLRLLDVGVADLGATVCPRSVGSGRRNGPDSYARTWNCASRSVRCQFSCGRTAGSLRASRGSYGGSASVSGFAPGL